MSGDLNNDGNDDLLVVNGSRNITVYYNDGGGKFTQKTYFPSANIAQVAIADFNHDGNLDVAYIQNSVSPVQAFVALGDGKGGHNTSSGIQSG